jgi:hypothetical protein
MRGGCGFGSNYAGNWSREVGIASGIRKQAAKLMTGCCGVFGK